MKRLYSVNKVLRQRTRQDATPHQKLAVSLQDELSVTPMSEPEHRFPATAECSPVNRPPSAYPFMKRRVQAPSKSHIPNPNLKKSPSESGSSHAPLRRPMITADGQRLKRPLSPLLRLENGWECQNVYQRNPDTREPTWVNRWIKAEEKTVDVQRFRCLNSSERFINPMTCDLPFVASSGKPSNHAPSKLDPRRPRSDSASYSLRNLGVTNVYEVTSIRGKTTAKQSGECVALEQGERRPSTRKFRWDKNSVDAALAGKTAQSSSFQKRPDGGSLRNNIPYARSKYFKPVSGGDAAQEITSMGDGKTMKRYMQDVLEREAGRYGIGRRKRVKSSVEGESTEDEGLDGG